MRNRTQSGMSYAFVRFSMIYGVPWKQFGKDLKNEIEQDNVMNGAAALAYYWILAIFPSMLVLLSLLAYLPIPDLQQSIMDFLAQVLPGDTSKMFTNTIGEITSEKKGGILSFGLLFTLWAASNGMYAIMQQLNITYDVVEGRSFFKVRGTALSLTLLVGTLFVAGFTMIIFGGKLQVLLVDAIGASSVIFALFSVLRWVVVFLAMTMAFAVTFYFGPDVEQEFKFITPGSIFAVTILFLASLGFKFYVENFGDYNATYGSIGAVITLMLWLNIVGLVILLGSEINALIEHYSPKGKNKGEKTENHEAA